MGMINLKIRSIWGGHSPSPYFTGEGQYFQSVGIDPDLPITDAVGDRLASGAIRPSAYADFTGANVSADPIKIITTPKDNKVYAVMSDGKIVSYTSAFGTETLVGTVTGSAATGAEYYNNYIYVASNTDIARYGPLDGTPALTQTVWTGATLGTQTALGNATYPTIRGGGAHPKHWMFAHLDNMYVLDFDPSTSTAATRGRGLVHKVITTYGSDQGDTNNSSAYNVLDLPYDMLPTCGVGYGTDVIIGASRGTDSTLGQGNAKLYFWDTFAPSFYRAVELPDPYVSAILNHNGTIYVWTGPHSTGTDVSNGYRLLVYLGGDSFKEIYYSDVGAPPLPGGVQAVGNKIAWGTFTQLNTTTAASPDYYPVVMSINSKNAGIPSGAHCIARATGAGAAADGMVTALGAVQHSSFSYPKFVIGWRDASGYGIDSQSTTYGTSIFRYAPPIIGRKFTIKRIRIHLAQAVAANMTITPKVYLDEFSSSDTGGLTVINNTNYANSERTITYYPNISGDHNFVFELAFSGSALVTVLPYLDIDVEVREDNQ